MYFVYLLTNNNNQYKIGITNNTEKRIKTLQTASPTKLEYLKIKKVKNRRAALNIEKDIHSGLNSFRDQGEWFSLDARLLKILDQILD